MEIFRNTVSGVLYGLKDSLIGISAVRYLYLTPELTNTGSNVNIQTSANSSSSSSVSGDQVQPISLRRPLQQQHRRQNIARNNIFYCCFLNGVIFLLSIILIDYLLLPVLYKVATLIFGAEGSSHGKVWSWMRPLLSTIISAFWILPIFLLSRIVNIFFFQEIADSSFRGRSQQLRSIPKLFADFFFSLFVQALFLVQAHLVTYTPIVYVNQLLGHAHLSLLYSLYSFEYKWFNMGWELHKRLHFIESNWPYFIGFGLPLAVLTSLSDSFILNGCIFSLLFPLFIISSNEAKPKRGFCDKQIPIFQPVVYFSNTFLKFVLFFFQSSIIKAIPTTRSR